MIYDYYKIIFSTKDKKREATKVNETPNGSQNVLQKFMKIFCVWGDVYCRKSQCRKEQFCYFYFLGLTKS